MTITRITGKPDTRYSLKKGERLTGHKKISSLFESGKRCDSFPLRLIFNKTTQEEFPVIMAVVVPKRLIRKASARNQVKRRIREVYRMHKPELPTEGVSLHLLIQYRSDKPFDYQTIEAAYLKAVITMIKKLENKTSE